MRKCILTLIAIFGTFSTINAQWSDNPAKNNRITPEGQEIYDWEIKPDKDGNTFVMFNAPTGGTTATFLQILDKEGKKVLPEEGKLISNEETRSYTVVNDYMLIDKDGNAIIAVSDLRNAPAGSYDLSYTLYKVSPSGEMLWGADGLDIEEGRTNSFEAQIKMVQIEDGSYVVAWSASYGNLHCIRMQRISSDGKLLWQDIDLKDDNITYFYPYLANAGNNQVILVYTRGTNQDLMARKIDFDGSAVWPEDTRIYRGGFGTTPLQTVLSICPDPNGGIFVGWHDDRYYTNVESAFISYIKPNGELGYTAGEEGQQTGYAGFRSFSPKMLYSETENALYVIWRETTQGQGQQRIMMQKVAMSGELLWGSEGVDIVPWDEQSVGYYSIQKSKHNDIAAFYMISEKYGRVFPYVTLIDKATGEYKWEDEPVILSSYVSEKGSLTSTPLIDESFWLTMWGDARENKKTLFLQKVNTNGTLEIVNSIEMNSLPTANKFQLNYLSSQNIEFIINNDRGEMIDINLYSIDGKKIETIYKGYIAEGIQSVNWTNKNRINKGMYIVTLTTGRDKQTIRMILP